MFACRFTIGIATLSSAPCSGYAFVNHMFGSAVLPLYSCNVSPSQSPSRTQQHRLAIRLRMQSAFPEDSGKSRNYDASSQSAFPNSGPVDATAESISSFSSLKDSYSEYTEDDQRSIEFNTAYNVAPPLTRQLRWKEEAKIQSRFKTGDDLIELRQRVAYLRQKLNDAKKNINSMRKNSSEVKLKLMHKQIQQIEVDISKASAQDAEVWYAHMQEVLSGAEAKGDVEMAEKARLDVEEARRCIPQLNMHGLWVGKYGEHGYEMVNITYVGDTLIATKVTGDHNVPRGQVSFTCNLSPRLQYQTLLSPLEPIVLQERAARQWGKKYLPRYPGKGQVASEGYKNAQWLDGQLILVDRFFSFAWIPLGHQVFFGRPSPELTIKMIKEQHEQEIKKDLLACQRETAESILEETYWIMKETDIFNKEGSFE